MISGTSFQGISSTLHDLFSRSLRALGTVALVQPEGTILFVNADNAADVGTLPAAASNCHRYLHLKSGDIALTNDPFSGGTHLSDFTLVLGLSLHSTGKDLDLLLATRVKFAPLLPPGRKLDDEGVHVPPMPLGLPNGAVNQDLLRAISGHPLAPHGLVDGLCAALDRMKAAAATLRRIARDPGSPLRKPNFETYIEDSSHMFDALMHRLPLGTSQVARAIPTGEMMKVQLVISEGRIVFDFTQTAAARDAAGTIALTELETFGACWAAIVAPFDEVLPMNSGTFQHLRVSTPSRSLVSATPPVATFRGASEGVAHIGRISFDVLAKSQPAFRIAAGPESNALFQLRFSDGRKFALELPPGGGASARSKGTDASSSWARSKFHATEEVEALFPLRWLSAGLRKGSGGAGKNRGGLGAVVSLEVLEACELSWMDPSLGRRSEGIDQGRAGLPSTIEIVRAGSVERETLADVIGKIALASGDQVHLLSGGGGGFGEAE